MKARRWLGVLTVGILLLSTLLGACATGSQEPQYPTKAIEYVCSAGAGGSTDLVARATADYVSKKWGQPVSVVNKTGGGTVVGAQYALQQAKPDGYTVYAESHSSSTMLVAGMVEPPVKMEDRIFVGRTIADPIAFAVKADAPWKTFQEFTDWIKKNPKELTWASVGPSGLSAFGISEMLSAIGVNPADTRMVATAGAAESVEKLAGGHVVLANHTVAELYTMAQAGKIRVLAVVADKRSPAMPDVPTATEAGVPNLTTKWWTGVSVPKGTPQSVVDKWAKTLEEMTKDKVFLDKAENLHVGVSYLGPVDWKDALYKEAEYYTKLATKIGVRK